MARWVDAYWDSPVVSGVPRSARRSGPYRAYLPDPLMGAPLLLSSGAEARIAQAERAVRSVSGGPSDLAGVARFLLRSEAIASSQIEGIAPSPRQVALAALEGEASLPKSAEMAQLVANNMLVVERARSELAGAQTITVEHLVGLQAALLSAQPQLHGLRTVQNWIGRSNHPLDADFVPPPPENIPALMQDLVDYLGTASHSPIVQAALVHAQFETIHPFVDGNGRVGRSLIHTVLTRRGLTPGAVLPVSMVLSTLRDDYVNGLTRFRHSGEFGSQEFHAAREAWIVAFSDAVTKASGQASLFSEALVTLRADWEERYEHFRKERGYERALRANSATALVMRDLPSTPVLTVSTVARIHGVSKPAAISALDELTNAGILSQSKRGRVNLFQSDEVLDLITIHERQLASTQFDTRINPPNRAVPALPQSGAWGALGFDLP